VTTHLLHHLCVVLPFSFLFSPSLSAATPVPIRSHLPLSFPFPLLHAKQQKGKTPSCHHRPPMAPSIPAVPREAESTTRTASSSSTSCCKQSNRGALNRRRFRRFLLRPRQTSSPIPSPSDVLRLHQPRQRLPGVVLDLLDLEFVSFPLSIFSRR
jgi:hypothetical protein